jgi:hypothetical protein
VDSPSFNPVVGRRLHAARLERIVPDIAQQRTSVGTGCIPERSRRGVRVVHEQVRHHCIGTTRGVFERQVDDSGCQNPEENRSLDNQRVSEYDCDDDPHEERPHLISFAGLLFVGFNNLLTFPSRNCPDFWFVAVIGIVIY